MSLAQNDRLSEDYSASQHNRHKETERLVAQEDSEYAVLCERLQSSRRRLKWLTVVLSVLLALALATLVAGMGPSSSGRELRTTPVPDCQ
jgi:hypothetical protein